MFSDLGMGLNLSGCKGGGRASQNGTSLGDSGSGGDEEMDDGSAKHVVRALYGFSGTNDDEVCTHPTPLIVLRVYWEHSRSHSHYTHTHTHTHLTTGSG